MAELKAMLKNTPVPPVKYGTSVGAKLAIGTFVAGLIATGIYFYAEKEEDNNSVEQTKTLENVLPETSEPVPDQPANESDQTVTSSPESEREQPTETSHEETSQEQTANESSKPEQPVLDVYDPSAELTESEPEIEEAAGERRSSVRAGAPSIIVEIENENRRYDFNYQFKSGKLYLYGPFERNLYEILEFFTDEKRTAFLYYKDNFYLLNDHTDKVQELTAVTDPTLIRKLREYRGK